MESLLIAYHGIYYIEPLRQHNKIIAYQLTFHKWFLVFNMHNGIWMLPTKSSHLWKVRYAIILLGWRLVIFYSLLLHWHFNWRQAFDIFMKFHKFENCQVFEFGVSIKIASKWVQTSLSFGPVVFEIACCVLKDDALTPVICAAES